MFVEKDEIDSDFCYAFRIVYWLYKKIKIKRSKTKSRIPSMSEATKPLDQKVVSEKKYDSKEVQKKSNVSSHNMTPMMLQYSKIKEDHYDKLLFYRMGDFYELFFKDAEIASKALGIQLTKRGKHQGDDIPMCGVPVHSADDYLERLIRKGFCVAVCEQTEDPSEAKKRGAKSVVKREVVRIVTPGTLTEDSLLDACQNNYLIAVYIKGGKAGKSYSVSCVDISTGEFIVLETSEADFLGEVLRLSPQEILVADANIEDANIKIISNNYSITTLPSQYFNSRSGEAELKRVLNITVIDSLGDFSRNEFSSISALLKYLEITQIDKFPVLSFPKKEKKNDVMVIDAATRANLELTKSIHGEKSGSLLASIDRTVTGAGSRMLSKWVSGPSTELELINRRHDIVSCFCKREALCNSLMGTLKSTPDIARSYSRLVLGRGGPRDLGAVRDALKVCSVLYAIINDQKDLIDVPEELSSIKDILQGSECNLKDKLDRALNIDLPFLKRDGGFVKEGYCTPLDHARNLKDKSKKIIAALQSRYIDETSIKSLKIKFNNVLGYFIEVTALHGKALLAEPYSNVFIHRQTLANSIRFTTEELNGLQTQILSATENSIALELEIFESLTKDIKDNETLLFDISEALSGLDVYLSFAHLAQEQGYVRPEICESYVYEIHGGRHPVVDMVLKKENEGPFIENDCILNSDNSDNNSGRIWMLTGPNMAGKSTFLRQNALIVILAQIGSFVPAQSVRIGLVDRLFSRVGASDDLARGRSTFMVEMVETAAILNQATERSFVILDEIGRGTATFDGLSIAWATLEYLHEQIKCRALFATHYHELTALTNDLANAKNMTMKVKDWKDDIIFLHKVIEGAADKSYGVQVAKLAGLPKTVIKRAMSVLELLENSDLQSTKSSIVEDLPLFSSFQESEDKSDLLEKSLLKEELDQLKPDELTPREALDLIYKWKDMSS